MNRRRDDETPSARSPAELVHFEMLMQRHLPRIRRVVRSVLRNPSDVEDAVQQTLLRAFGSVHTLRDVGAFATWVTQIALNEARMYARRTRKEGIRTDRSVEEFAGPSAEPDRRAAAREEIALVRRAVRRLPPRHRELLDLRYVDDLSIAQTAHLLGITVGTARVRLHRARTALRRALAR